MHDFQRDAQWATSQNPGLRLSGDSSLHECFQCHFIPAAFLFPVEVGKLFPCMVIFNLLFQELLRQESWFSPIIFVVRFVFLKPPDWYSGFAVYWIFFHAVRHHSAELSATTFRQRSMFLVFYTRLHLFCRHSSLQHWSVRLALEMDGFVSVSEDFTHFWSNVRRTGLFFSICKLVSTFNDDPMPTMKYISLMIPVGYLFQPYSPSSMYGWLSS